MNNYTFIDYKPVQNTFEDDILIGLQENPKRISPKYFYDERGSELFTRICELDEYYPTRTETSILKDHIESISKALGHSPFIIEYGSGTSEKIKSLLRETTGKASYMALDISKEFLIQSTQQLAEEFPRIVVYAVCTDYSKPTQLPEFCKYRENKIIYFPGSSFGNFNTSEQHAFLKNTRKNLNVGEKFLIGLDLVKSTEVLERAYNDFFGVTEAFNKNVLVRMNRELDTNFNIDEFKHIAFFNPKESRIEMHLESKINQYVRIHQKDILFEKGERIHTENSYKFHTANTERFFLQHNFKLNALWTDKQTYFGIFLFEAI